MERQRRTKVGEKTYGLKRGGQPWRHFDIQACPRMHKPGRTVDGHVNYMLEENPVYMLGYYPYGLNDVNI